MTAAREASIAISLTKSLSYCGVSRTAWYYTAETKFVYENQAFA